MTGTVILIVGNDDTATRIIPLLDYESIGNSIVAYDDYLETVAPQTSFTFTTSELVYEPIEFPEIETDDWLTLNSKQLSFVSGQIRKIWDNYHGIWIIWQAPKQKPYIELNRTMFMRRFRGNNKGRHWNRKPI